MFLTLPLQFHFVFIYYEYSMSFLKTPRLFKNHSNFIFGVLVLIIMGGASVGVALYLLQQPQDTRKGAYFAPIPTQNFNREMPILVISYYPPDPNNPENIDEKIAGPNSHGKKISDIRNSVNSMTQQILQDLTIATKYKGYQNTELQPSLKYVQYGQTIEALQKLPRGNSLGGGTYRPDYKKILTDMNICDYVDNKGVKQVWLWGYHFGEIVPVESDMAMGKLSSNFFNFSGYGDVSNSEKTNDLPVCNHTYVLNNYNYDRGVGEALEDHGHQFEALFNWLDARDTVPRDQWVDLLFWGRFVGAGSGSFDKMQNPGCGWVHTPPNGTEQYGWFNTQSVASDCIDWNPDRTGKKNSINCTTWSGSSSCPNDGGRAYKIWWMQNFPGANNGLIYQGHALRNWWDLVYDLDGVLQQGGGLYTPQSEVTYTITDITDKPALGNLAAKIVRSPSLLNYLPITINYQDGFGGVQKAQIMPTCSNGECYYEITPAYNWTSWWIANDTATAYDGAAGKLVVTSEKWAIETPTNEGYHAHLIKKVVTSLPDLGISQLASARGTYNPGDTADIYVYVNNQGTQTVTGGFTVEVKVIKKTTDGTLPVHDQIRVSSDAPLNPNEEIQLKITTSKFTEAGTYNITAMVDPDNKIKEGNENNNSFANRELTVKTPNNLPDIIVSGFSLDKTTVSDNGSVNAKVTVKNNGTVATGKFRVGVFTANVESSTDITTVKGFDIRLFDVPSLAPSGFSEQNVVIDDIFLNHTGSPRKYAVYVIADVENSVTESDENNRSASQIVTALSSATPAPTINPTASPTTSPSTEPTATPIAPIPTCKFTTDFNDDGRTDGGDYVIYIQNLMKEGKRLPGDVNCDGIVDGADYPYIAHNFSP